MANFGCRVLCSKMVVIVSIFITFVAVAPPGWAGGFAVPLPDTSTPTALKLGWRVACAGYSLRDRTMCEAIDALAAMGILNIEPVDNGVKLSKTDGTTVDFHMSSAKRGELKKYMADRGMKMPAYYVGYNKGSMTNSKLWDFLKEMGVEVLCGEPEPANLAAVEKLSKQYDIPMAIHNHPKGSSTYWNPDEAIKLISSQGAIGPMVGFCPDVGHWSRSGLDVIKGISAYHTNRTIFDLHVKDITNPGSTGSPDVALGKGKVPYRQLFDSLYAWKWRGVITIELEADPAQLKEIDSCARYIEIYAKSKMISPVSRPILPVASHRGKARVSVAIGGNALSQRVQGNVAGGGCSAYTISGKTAGGRDRAAASVTIGKPAGVYIVRYGSSE